MLEIKKLNAGYGDRIILDGISETLAAGDTLAIVGETGAGKTTLAMSVMRLGEVRATGEVLFRGTDLLGLSPREMEKIRWNDIAMVFQDVDSAMHPLLRVIDQIAEPIVAHGLLPKAPAEQKAAALLLKVGLPTEKHRDYPHQLSSGQKQRALIAMALSNDPEILILDEPTASLDSVTKTDVVHVLQEVAASTSLIVITHDLATAAQLCRRTAVLYGGKIVESGPTTSVLLDPRHPYTRGLVRSFPNMTTTKDLQGIPGTYSDSEKGCPFEPRCTQRIAACKERFPELREADGRLVACHRGGIVPLLELRHFSTTFDWDFSLEDIDLTIYHGETVAVVGESGSGKTSLARTIMGLIPSDDGGIYLEGAEVGRRSREFYRTVQMIFQNPRESINPRFSVLEAVMEPLRVQRMGTREENGARARAMLEEVELPSSDRFLDSYCLSLSSGEAQRVAIARALVLEPRLLVADEPTSALDPSVQAKIAKLLLDLQERKGLSLLFITHDIALARKISDRIVVVKAGRVVEEGRSDAVTTRPSDPYTIRLVSAAPALTVGGAEERVSPDSLEVSE